MSLWPFKPINEVIEVLEWKTDVIRARAGEQRFRIRERPRRQWHFSHFLTPDNQSAARAIIRGASSIRVPDWIRSIYTGSVSSGLSVSISMTTTGLGLSAGAYVVLWGGIDNFEVCEIESLTASTLVLESVATARSSVTIYRADNARMSVELSITRDATPFQFAQISFESPAVDVYAATTYSQYRGHDILPVVPLISGGEYDENIQWQFDVLDNGSGIPSSSKYRDLIDEKFMMRWHVFTQSEINELRAWVASRYGKWLAFWQSTWQNDLTVAADITAIATTLRVYSPAGTSLLGRTSFDLEIGTPSGVYRRRVTSVSAGPLVGGKPTFDLVMDSAFGVAVSSSAFGRISFLRCARFDSDRVEFLHRPQEGLAVIIPCIEVPVP